MNARKLASVAVCAALSFGMMTSAGYAQGQQAEAWQRHAQELLQKGIHPYYPGDEAMDPKIFRGQKPVIKNYRPPAKRKVDPKKPLTFHPAFATGQMGAQQVINDSSNVVVYFVPHADDETLSMAADIRNRIYQGYQVYMVLMSHGEKSVARDVINGETDIYSDGGGGTVKVCSWHGHQHNTDKEPWQTLEQFGEVRERDFYRVAAELGVPSTNLFVYTLTNDAFDRAQVKSIFLQFKEWFPNASFRTMSRWDYHPDHKILGDVMYEMEREGSMDPAKTVYFVSIYKARWLGTSDIPVTLYNGTFLNPGDSQYVANAVNNVYKKYDPVNDLYGTGYHSVPSQFDSLMNDMTIKYHYDNE